MAKIISAEKIENMVSFYDHGYNAKEIARLAGVSRTFASQVMRLIAAVRGNDFATVCLLIKQLRNTRAARIVCEYEGFDWGVVETWLRSMEETTEEEAPTEEAIEAETQTEEVIEAVEEFPLVKEDMTQSEINTALQVLIGKLDTLIEIERSIWELWSK